VSYLLIEIKVIVLQLFLKSDCVIIISSILSVLFIDRNKSDCVTIISSKVVYGLGILYLYMRWMLFIRKKPRSKMASCMCLFLIKKTSII